MDPQHPPHLPPTPAPNLMHTQSFIALASSFTISVKSLPYRDVAKTNEIICKKCLKLQKMDYIIMAVKLSIGEMKLDDSE